MRRQTLMCFASKSKSTPAPAPAPVTPNPENAPAANPTDSRQRVTSATTGGAGGSDPLNQSQLGA